MWGLGEALPRLMQQIKAHRPSSEGLVNKTHQAQMEVTVDLLVCGERGDKNFGLGQRARVFQCVMPILSNHTYLFTGTGIYQL